MNKRRIKIIGFGLLVLMSLSLAITTLHSHHHNLSHRHDFVDTGSCITADTSVCPICGIFRANTSSFSSAVKAVFRAEEIVIDDAPSVASISLIANTSRSPPFIA